jgi:hypothetical protein
MSTKAHIKLNSSVEIYEETSEPQSENGKWVGDNIYFLSECNMIDLVKIDPKKGNLNVALLKPDGGFYQHFHLLLCDVLRIEYDIYGLEVVIKGGTQTAKNLILAKE